MNLQLHTKDKMKNSLVAACRMAWVVGAALLSACAAPSTAPVAPINNTVATAPVTRMATPATTAAAPVTGITTPTPALPMPLTRLVPQPEGTPLPQQDPTIADTWPPEFKQLIDNMITLFPKNTIGPAPDIKEVQRKMGITLTERPLNSVERTYLSKRYEIGGTRYADATTSEVFRAFYSIGKDYNQRGERSQTLSLEIGPKQSGFCLNPYDFAVYTGWKFSNFDTSPHANIRRWPPAYVWGMFAWSNTGRYGGPGYTILVNMIQDAAGKTIGADCIYSITVSGRYPKEE